MFLFVLLGYNHVHRPVSRKKRHKTLFRRADPPSLPAAATPGPEETHSEPGWEGMARLAQKLDAFPLTHGNRVEFFYEGHPA